MKYLAQCHKAGQQHIREPNAGMLLTMLLGSLPLSHFIFNRPVARRFTTLSPHILLDMCVECKLQISKTRATVSPSQGLSGWTQLASLLRDLLGLDLFA